jgi:MOSC domain-containing protein YiiM
MAGVERARLEAGLGEVFSAPADEGTLELIVRRPAENERELLDAGELDAEVGLVGDMWSTRPSSKGPDGGPDPEAQLTVMNARAARLVADGDSLERWAAAGDQLYVDLDISEANLPAGTRVAIGDAVIEVTPAPHTGCGKFLKRFGVDAVKVFNSADGRAARLRGLNARVIEPGVVRRGDRVAKLTH